MDKVIQVDLKCDGMQELFISVIVKTCPGRLVVSGST